MSARRAARIVREVMLTSAALLGVLCILLTVAGAVAGVRPLVVQSGSMAPSIQTGDLSISRTVPATQLERGDVVSVTTASGSRVTHRIVDISGAGDRRELFLKGDANKAADQEAYPVSSAEKVQFTIAKLGYVVNAAAAPGGLFVLGMYVALLLALVFRRPGGGPTEPPREGGLRHGKRARKSDGDRLLVRSATVGFVAVSLIVATPAIAAAWADSAVVSGTSFSAAAAVLPPGTPTCSTSTNPLTATISWPEKDPLYDYEVTLTLRHANHEATPLGTIVSTKQATGSAVSVSFSTAADFGHTTAIAAHNLVERFDVDVRSFVAGAPGWHSETVKAAQQIEVHTRQAVVPVVTHIQCHHPVP